MSGRLDSANALLCVRRVDLQKSKNGRESGDSGVVIGTSEKRCAPVSVRMANYRLINNYSV